MAVPQGPVVEILEGESLTRVGRVESPEFSRTPVKTATGTNSSAAPHGIAITEDGGKVYVGLENADVPGVVVIDARGGRVLKKSTCCCRAATTWPSSPALASSTTRIAMTTVWS